MSKRIVPVIAILTIACLLLCSCTKTISGSVQTVVKECQEVANNEKATVQVTGNPSLDYITDYFRLTDGEYSVWVSLADSEKNKKGPAGRVTVKGELLTGMTDFNSVTIRNAVIID